MMDKSAHRPKLATPTTNEVWHLNGFNVCEIIVIRDGPAPDGTRYIDGRHSISVAVFESAEDAQEAVAHHNRNLPTPSYGDVYKP